MNTFLSPGITELTFPDGQPHIKVTDEYDVQAPVICRITNPADLFKLQMLASMNPFRNGLTIVYLMGGRMDRSISNREPFTLEIVAKAINAMEWKKVNIFCPHSQVSMELINNSNRLLVEEEHFYRMSIYAAAGKFTPYLDMSNPENDGIANSNIRFMVRNGHVFSIVFPDKGCSDRMRDTIDFKDFRHANYVVLDKKRELSTGKILGMKIVEGTPSAHCIILDDLCDGGATFMGAGECLRESGAERVDLAVCHGIFSKGGAIKNIDHSFTTNSYRDTSVDEQLVSVRKFFV